jgi:hypothetical protein
VHIVKTAPNNPLRLKAAERVRHALNMNRVGTLIELLDNQQRAAVRWDDGSSSEADINHLRRVT